MNGAPTEAELTSLPFSAFVWSALPEAEINSADQETKKSHAISIVP